MVIYLDADAMDETFNAPNKNSFENETGDVKSSHDFNRFFNFSICCSNAILLFFNALILFRLSSGFPIDISLIIPL